VPSERLQEICWVVNSEEGVPSASDRCFRLPTDSFGFRTYQKAIMLLRSSGLPWKSTFVLKEAALVCLLGNVALGWIGVGTASDSTASRVASCGLHVARPCVPCHRSRADSRCDGFCLLSRLTAEHLLRRQAHGARRHRARRFLGGRHPGGSARRPRPRGEPSMEAEGGEAGKRGGSGGGSRASSNQPWVRPRSPLQSRSSLTRPSPAPDDAAGVVLCCGPSFSGLC